MSMRLVFPFLAAVRRSGVNPGILQFLSRSPEDSRISVHSAARLVQAAIELTGDPGLGLAAALETSMGDYGVLEYAAGSCTTLGEALEYLCRNYEVLDETSSLAYACSQGRVQIVLQQPPELLSRVTIDFTLSMLYLGYVRWIGQRPADYCAWFPYPEPEDISRHRMIFGDATKLKFSADRVAVDFPEVEMRRPLKFSDSKLHSILAERASEASDSGPLRDPCLLDEVRSSIVELLPEARATLHEVAKRLNTTERTLVRRLAGEQANFRQILADIRCARALHYLMVDGLTVEEVSERLGYSEPAAFRRAFRGWMGKWPSAYRRQRA